MAALAVAPAGAEPDDRAAAAAGSQATDSALGPHSTPRSRRPSSSRRALLPGIKQLDPTIGAGLPWLAQATALVSRAELGGLLNYLTPAVQNTSSDARARPRRCWPPGDQLAQCFSHNIDPAGNEVIQDPPGGTTGIPVYQEFFQSAVGLAGAAQNFDGNGRYMRASGRRRLDPCPDELDPGLRARCSATPCCRRSAPAPRGPGTRRRCAATFRATKNPAPNLNVATTGADAVKRAIRIHRRDFIAIVVLVAIAIAVTRLHPRAPAGVHRFGCKNYYTVKAEFATAAAVTSGQGQTVDIAGVQVGQVGGVTAPERPRRRDDEHLQAVRADLPQRDRAAAAAHAAEGHVPGARPGDQERRGGAQRRDARRGRARNPDVDFDQILASLDADTRNYLLLLLAGGAQAFQRPGQPRPAAEHGRGRRPARHVQAVRAR